MPVDGAQRLGLKALYPPVMSRTVMPSISREYRLPAKEISLAVDAAS